jgi:hypothetical protein
MNDNNVTTLTYYKQHNEHQGPPTAEEMNERGWRRMNTMTNSGDKSDARRQCRRRGFLYFLFSIPPLQAPAHRVNLFSCILYIVKYNLNTVATEEQPGFWAFMLSGCLEPGNTRKPLKTWKHTLVFS